MNSKTTPRRKELYSDLIHKPDEDTKWVYFCIPICFAVLLSLFLNGKSCNIYD